MTNRKSEPTMKMLLAIMLLGIFSIIAFFIYTNQHHDAQNAPIQQPYTPNMQDLPQQEPYPNVTRPDKDALNETMRRWNEVITTRQPSTMSIDYMISGKRMSMETQANATAYRYNNSMMIAIYQHNVESRAYKDAMMFCRKLSAWQCAKSANDYPGFIGDPEHLLHRYNDTYLVESDGVTTPEPATCFIVKGDNKIGSRTCYASDGAMVYQEYWSPFLRYNMTAISRGEATASDLELPEEGVWQ